MNVFFIWVKIQIAGCIFHFPELQIYAEKYILVQQMFGLNLYLENDNEEQYSTEQSALKSSHFTFSE